MGVTQDDETINRAVLRTAFRAGIPETDQPLHDGASMGSGDYAVVIVYSVNEADPEAIDEDERNIVRSQLLQANTASAWAEFNRNLRTNADVTVYEEIL